jgi:PKHD-type hydroxylase
LFLEIKNLLTSADIARLTALARDLRFVDGRVTNPANTTKQNLQADYADPKYAESVQLLQTAIGRSEEFMNFACPIIAAAEPHGPAKYGAHAARRS